MAFKKYLMTVLPFTVRLLITSESAYWSVWFQAIACKRNGQSLLDSQNFIFKMNQIRTDQLITKTWDYERFTYKDNFIGSKDPNTANTTYGYGALKGNYNPIAEKWSFNYKPEPQGGFMNFTSRNLTLLRQNLGLYQTKN